MYRYLFEAAFFSQKTEIYIFFAIESSIYNYYYENKNKKNRSVNDLIDNDNVIIKSPIHNKIQNSSNNTGSFREPQSLRATKKNIKHNEIFLTEDKKWGWFVDIENNIG